MNERYTDAYILFKSQCMDGNVLKAYYPFFAQIVLDEKWEEIDENKIKERFEIKYGIPMTVSFVRQVLGEGITNGSIVKKSGKYIADIQILKECSLRTELFEEQWKCLEKDFQAFCYERCNENEKIEIKKEEFEKAVVELIDTHNVKYIIDNDWNSYEQTEDVSFYWHSYVKELSSRNAELFDFLAYLSASNAYREALFLSAEGKVEYDNLNVYLDSPMVFALLDMDSPERCISYKKLVEDMQKAGCNVQVLDNNFQEVIGILERASGWASSTAYDISKANKVAKYFHDSGMTYAEMMETCECIEEQLNQMGVTVKQTEYDILSNDFQEDENILQEMVEVKYHEHNMAISEEKKESIRCDVRSIVMVYRERKGRVSSRIQTCGHIMLTLNGALANVCKQYESNRSISSGHIPACVSADLFGAILWLDTPLSSVEYQRKKILGDCYSALQPSKALLEKYVASLEVARKTGEIDEKKYLLMRSHTVATEALMNITKGDYARFNDRTYIEVFDEIQSIARKEYYEEQQRHDETKEKLNEKEEELMKSKSVIDDLQKRLDQIEENNQRQKVAEYEKKCNRLGFFVAVIIFAIPYMLLYVGFEFAKAYWTTQITLRNALFVAGTVVVSLVVPFVFDRIKRKCIEVVKKRVHVE